MQLLYSNYSFSFRPPRNVNNISLPTDEERKKRLRAIRSIKKNLRKIPRMCWVQRFVIYVIFLDFSLSESSSLLYLQFLLISFFSIYSFRFTIHFCWYFRFLLFIRVCEWIEANFSIDFSSHSMNYSHNFQAFVREEKYNYNDLLYRTNQELTNLNTLEQY